MELVLTFAQLFLAMAKFKQVCLCSSGLWKRLIILNTGWPGFPSHPVLFFKYKTFGSVNQSVSSRFLLGILSDRATCRFCVNITLHIKYNFSKTCCTRFEEVGEWGTIAGD